MPDPIGLITSTISAFFQILGKVLSPILGWCFKHPLPVIFGFVVVFLCVSFFPGMSSGQLLIAFACGALLPVIISRRSSQRFPGRSRKQLGEGQATADWAGRKDLEQEGLLADNGLILGRSQSTRFNSSLPMLRFNQDQEGKEGNLITIAPAGAGKGAGVVIPNLLTYPGSVVVTDPKGENYMVTARTRKRMGQAVFCLDPFDVCKGERKARLNPLDLIDPSSHDVMDDAKVLADTLILRSGQEKDSERFFNDMAVALLQGLIMFVACEAPEDRRNLVEVRNLLTEPPEDLNITLSVMESSSAVHGLIARAASKFRGLNEKVRTDVLATAISNTEFLDSPAVMKSMSRSSFDIRDLKKSGEVSLYFILPTDKLAAYSRLLRLWVATTIQAMIRVPGKPKNRVLFLLDEMAQMGPMEPLVQAVSILRGYGGTLWMIFQDLSQLKSIYPDNKWQTFVANSIVQQYFGVSDLDTAKYVSELLGKRTIVTQSQSKGHSSSWGGADSTNHGTSTQEQARSLLHPDEVLRLDRSEQLVIIRGFFPIKATKIQYYKDPSFAKLYDINPQHQSI